MGTSTEEAGAHAALLSQLDAERQRAEALAAALRQVYARKATLTLRLKKMRRLVLVLGAPVLVLAAPLLVPAYLVIRRRRRQTTRHRSQPTFAAQNQRARPARDPAHEVATAATPDTFALARMIGNDLIPRHARGQSATNLRCILETEPDLPDCTSTGWSIASSTQSRTARSWRCLTAKGRITHACSSIGRSMPTSATTTMCFPHPGYLVSPELAQLDVAQQMRARIQYNRLRNTYVINDNGARNAALNIGQRAAKWVLPFDGNCFVSEPAWERIRAEIIADPEKRYFSVPMIRFASNDNALADQPPEAATEEPQIAFRADAGQRFDDRHPYSRRPKVDCWPASASTGLGGNGPAIRGTWRPAGLSRTPI